jgi:predicted metal-binding membrane protein
LPLSTLERGQLAVLALLAALTVGAWTLTIRMGHALGASVGSGSSGVSSTDAALHIHHAGMVMHEVGEAAVLGMSGATWSLTAFAAFIFAWAVMMAAMMFPGVAPMILLVHAMARRGASEGGWAATSLFASGYLIVWTIVGASTWVAARAGSGLIGRMGAGGATWTPMALGAVLALAGLYQMSPIKNLCLDHCRSPLAYIVGRWRNGRMGALRMGVGHGLYCLGCCLGLFAVLVITGVMSLAWMLLLTLVDFAEKVLPKGRLMARAVGVAFLVLGVLVASGRVVMPWTA